jgi:nitrogen fixation negative regulator NifL
MFPSDEVFVVESEETQRQLQKYLKDYQYALDQSAIVAITDVTGTILWANEQFCAISGYDRAELLGQNHRLLKSGEHSKAFFKEMWKTIAQGKVWKGEVCNRAKNGSLYWVNTTIVPFLNDKKKPYQYLAIRFDITARKATQHALLEQQRMFLAMFNEAPIGALLTTLEGEIIQANRNIQDLSGYGNELLGLNVSSLLPEEDATHLHQEIETMQCAQCKHNASLPLRLQTKSGDRVHVQLSATLLQRDAPLTPYLILQIQDLSELRQAQNHLLHAARLSGIGEVAASIAHELRTPLSSIRLIAEKLRLQHSLGQPIDMDKLNNIPRVVDRCNKIIDHIRSYSRRETVHTFQNINLNQVIHSALLLVERNLMHRQITLHQELAESLPEIQGNAMQLEQVLINLINNARDAMEEAPVRELTLRTYEEDQKVCVEVKDTGGGISPEVQEYIYNAFYTTKEEGKGTGLGMSISKGIVHDHNGEISFDSHPNQGTCFQLCFPTSGSAASPTPIA